MEIKCDCCDITFPYKGGKAHFNRSKHHYCSRKCQAIGNNILQENHISRMAGKDATDNRNKRYRIWCNVKKRAKKKGIEFTLLPEDIPEIPKVCPILGIPIKENNKCSPLDSSPSLDRIDNSKGYIPDNVRIISNRANRLRQDGRIEEWRLLIQDAEKIQS